MKPAFLAVGLLATLAIAAGSAIAQPVAPGTQHEKLDRIERKVDEILERLKVPTPPPVKPVEPPPPVKPAEPPPPNVPNPFAEWCSQGMSIVDITVWKLHRGLTPAEVAQACDAGCTCPQRNPGAPIDPGPGSGVNPFGFDLGTGGGTVLQHTVAAQQTITLTFTVLPSTRNVDITVIGVGGSWFTEVTDSGPGFADRKTTIRGTDYRHKAINEPLPPGTYTYTVAVDVGGRIGVQFNPT